MGILAVIHCTLNDIVDEVVETIVMQHGNFLKIF